MATVYLARDLRHDRLVAVKVFRGDLAEGEQAEQFLREIQIAARLSHPNILPLHDSGEAEGQVEGVGVVADDVVAGALGAVVIAALAAGGLFA